MINFNFYLINAVCTLVFSTVITLSKSVPPDPDCYKDMKEIVEARGYDLGS